MAASSSASASASADDSILDQARFFAKHDPNEKTRTCIQELLEAHSSGSGAAGSKIPAGVPASLWAPAGASTAEEVANSLRTLFGARLKFGTAGLRGPMG